MHQGRFEQANKSEFSWSLDQVELYCDSNRHGTALNAQLRKDVADMELHGRLTDKEAPSDFSIGWTADCTPDHRPVIGLIKDGET